MSYDADDNEPEIIPPRGKWIICPVCHGNGSHVNPSIDANGLSREDFDEDPDFRESYMNGDYDVRCSTCNGAGKVRERDEDGESIHERLSRRAAERRLAAQEDGNVEAYLSAHDSRWG